VDRKKRERWHRMRLVGYVLIGTSIPAGFAFVLALFFGPSSIFPLIANVLAVVMVAELIGMAYLVFVDSGPTTSPIDQTAPAPLMETPLQTVEEYIQRGAERANAGDVSSAILDFSAALTLDPQNATAYFLRGKAYIRVDRIRAADDFRKVLALEPNHPQAATMRNFVNDAG
jgi:tetratricopeptide (TPR) repeat protein